MLMPLILSDWPLFFWAKTSRIRSLMLSYFFQFFPCYRVVTRNWTVLTHQVIISTLFATAALFLFYWQKRMARVEEKSEGQTFPRTAVDKCNCQRTQDNSSILQLWLQKTLCENPAVKDWGINFQVQRPLSFRGLPSCCECGTERRKHPEGNCCFLLGRCFPQR